MMPSPPPTPFEKEFAQLTQGFRDDAEALMTRSLKVRRAFADIEAFLIASNTNEKLRQAEIAVRTRSAAPALDVKAYEIGQQKQFDDAVEIITLNLSYSRDVLIDYVRVLREADIFKNVSLPAVAPPVQGVIPMEPKGFFGRLRSMFDAIKSQERKDFEKSIALVEGKLQEVQLVNERWHTFVMQHREFIGYAVKFGGDAMYGYLLTELRNLTDVKLRVLPIFDSGIRIHLDHIQKLFASIASGMAQASASQMYQQQMFGSMGFGMGQSMMQPQAMMQQPQPQNGH